MTTLRALNPPAPATTGADHLVRAIANGAFLDRDQIREVAKAIDDIAGGLTVYGVARLADIPGYIDERRKRALADIATALGVFDAVEAARGVIDGDTDGAPHRWRPINAFSGRVLMWRCGGCGVSAPAHYRDGELRDLNKEEAGEPGGDAYCPAEVIRRALENQQPKEG